MLATRKRTGGIVAALAVLGVLLLGAGSAQAISWIWTLDQDGNGTMGSEAEAANPFTPADYPPTFMNPFGTSEFTLTIAGRSSLAELQSGDTITLSGFFLPPDLCFGDTLNPTCPSFSVPGTLVGSIVETSVGSGRFDITFDEFLISHSGTSQTTESVTGSFPMIISTLPTTVIDDQLGSTQLPGGLSYINVPVYSIAGGALQPPPDEITGIRPFLPCQDGPGVALSSPLEPLADGTNFVDGTRLTMGGATCGTGLRNAYLDGQPEQPFLLGMTGELMLVPEPGTMVLMSLGLVGLAAAGRGRRAV